MTSKVTSTNRAARLQLRASLDRARHAAELLHNKEQALQRERTRLEGHARRTEQQWHCQCSDATTWLLRARALGAGAELTAIGAQDPQPAVVAIAWQAAMGVTYPGEVTCTPGPAPALVTTAALVPTTTAYRAALVAGAEQAAASIALRRLETELSGTRRRRRAIEQRLRPRLEKQLHQLDLDLDERDREAALRSQLANRRRTHDEQNPRRRR